MKLHIEKWMSDLELVLVALPLCKVYCLYLFCLKSYVHFVAATFFLGHPVYINHDPVMTLTYLTARST